METVAVTTDGAIRPDSIQSTNSIQYVYTDNQTIRIRKEWLRMLK